MADEVVEVPADKPAWKVRKTPAAIEKKRAWALQRDAELAERLRAIEAAWADLVSAQEKAMAEVRTAEAGLRHELSDLEAARREVATKRNLEQLRLLEYQRRVAEQTEHLRARQAEGEALLKEVELREAELTALQAKGASVEAPFAKRREKLDKDRDRLKRRLDHHQAMHGELLVGDRLSPTGDEAEIVEKLTAGASEPVDPRVADSATLTPMPDWFGDAETKALRADFEAHVDKCQTCGQSSGPTECCETAQYWVKALGLGLQEVRDERQDSEASKIEGWIMGGSGGRCGDGR